MALPIVAVVGRPNVGKSTIVNRLAGAGDAIVHETSGVTRDRSYHRADWGGRDFMLIDTGGIEFADDDTFGDSIRAQALMAAREADVVLLVVEGATGPLAADDDVARILRDADAPALLVVNKLDDPAAEEALHDFWSLGLGEPMPVSAVHGHGTGDLLDAVVAALPPDTGREEDTDSVAVAVVGRPNAGKSSVFNRLAGTERTIVSEVPGTTRDAVDTLIERDGTRYLLIDTAGLRRRARIDEPVEYYGFVRAMRALDRADVALLIIDSPLGITSQDQRVADYAGERACAVVVLLNKWDLMDTDEAREGLEADLPRKLGFIDHAPVLRVSAKTGRSIPKVFAVMDAVYESYTRSVSTRDLNRFLTEIRQVGHTITKGARTLRLKYVTQTGTQPPEFTFFANDPQLVDATYERYLTNRLREAYELAGTPLVLRFRRTD